MKIGTRVSLMISLLILLMVAGISTVFFVAEKKVLVTEIQNRPLILVQSLRQVAEEWRAVRDDIMLLNYLKLLRKTEGVVYGMVARRDGLVMAHTDNAQWDTTLADPDSKRILATQGLSQSVVKEPAGRAVMDLALPLGQAGPDMVVRVGFSKEYIDAQVAAVLGQHQKRIFIISAVALILGLLLSMGLAQTIIRPIRKLAEATAIIGKGKLDHSIPVESKDELGSLARDFNKMAEQLKELDQLKKDFVSSVTHELRSPLHSSRLYLGLFFKGGAGPLSEKQTEYLKIIDNNTVRLARFIDDLLDLAKIERGKLEVQKQEFSLVEVLADMRTMFMPHSDQKKIIFDIQPAESLPKVYGDPERTRQILINLLSNAFKFTPEGGTIAIESAVNDGKVSLAVKDSGQGIPADQLDSIFNKFEQVKGVRTKMGAQQKGTGLGLAIVKALVEAQGGSIRVESELQKGSRFIFTVPLKS
jgi:signal transduction histidine kinase